MQRSTNYVPVNLFKCNIIYTERRNSHVYRKSKFYLNSNWFSYINNNK